MHYHKVWLRESYLGSIKQEQDQKLCTNKGIAIDKETSHDEKKAIENIIRSQES